MAFHLALQMKRWIVAGVAFNLLLPPLCEAQSCRDLLVDGGGAHSGSPDWVKHLAIAADRSIAASSATLAIIDAHLTAIKASQPRLRDVHFLSPFNGRELTLQVENAVSRRIRAGSDRDFDCLHSQLRVESVQSSGDDVTIRYADVYNIPLLVEQYASVPGVLAVQPALSIGDGSKISVRRHAERWEYVVDLGTGDCMAGCVTHELLYFVAASASTKPALKDRWRNDTDSDLPAWAQELKTK